MTALKKNLVNSIVLFVLLAVSSLTFTSLPQVQAANSIILNPGDEFLYQVTTHSSEFWNNTLTADANPNTNNFMNINAHNITEKSSFSFRVDSYDSFTELYDVTVIRGYTVQDRNQYTDLNYYWNGGWILGNNDSAIDESTHTIDESVYYSPETWSRYYNLSIDFTYDFSYASYLRNETITLVINDQSRTIDTLVYVYEDKPDGIGYVSEWTSTDYGVDYNVTNIYWETSYWYVDASNGFPVQLRVISYNIQKGNFYAYSPDLGTYINYTDISENVYEYVYQLKYATEHYPPTAADALMPYMWIDAVDGWAFDNYTGIMDFDLHFEELDVFNVDVFYLAPNSMDFVFIDNFIVDNSLVYTWHLNTTDLPYYNNWQHTFKFVVSDSIGKAVYYSYLEDNRIIVPDWPSWIYVRNEFNASLNADAELFDVKIFSDTTWNITATIYDNYTYMASQYYNGVGNYTFDLWLDYIDSGRYVQKDYWVEFVFTDAVGTVYMKNITMHIIPEGMDYWPPYIYIYDNNDGLLEYTLNADRWVNADISDDNAFTYSVYLDNNLILSDSAAGGVATVDILLSNYITTTGWHNLTFEAWDINNNVRTSTLRIHTYPEGYDYYKPSIEIYCPSDYEIPANNLVEVTVYDENPHLVIIKLNNNITVQSTYVNGESFWFYLMDYTSFLNIGMNELTVIANDTFGNVATETYYFYAGYATPESTPPVIYAPETFEFIIGRDNALSFTLDERFPDEYNVYLNGTLINGNISYRGDYQTLYIFLDSYISVVGYYELTIEAFDYWGNSANATVKITAMETPPDTTSPTISVDSPTDIYYQIGYDYYITFNFYDDYPDYYVILLDDVVILTNTYHQDESVTINLLDYITDVGYYNLTVVAYDLAGNSNYVTLWITADFTPPDQYPPTIETVAPTTLEYQINTHYVLSFNLYDENPDYYEIWVDGTIVQSDSFWDGKTVSVDLYDYHFTEGDHNFEIRAYDSFAHMSSFKILIHAVTEGTDSTGTETSGTETDTNQTISLPYNFMYAILGIIPIVAIYRKKRR